MFLLVWCFQKRVVKIDMTFSLQWVRNAVMYSSGNVQRVNNKCTRHNPVDRMTRLKWSFQSCFYWITLCQHDDETLSTFCLPSVFINITGISSAVILAAAIWAALSNAWRPGNSVTDSLSHQGRYIVRLIVTVYCCCSHGVVGNKPNLQMLWSRQWMPVGRLI
jgi:hypothetical protein